MKKIIALALALIMALSMASVAFAAYTPTAAFEASKYAAANKGKANLDTAPGEKITLWQNQTGAVKRAFAISSDFTSSEYDFNGASMIESIEWVKDAEVSKGAEEPVYDLVLTLKENLTSTTDKEIAGLVILTAKKNSGESDRYFLVAGEVANEVEYIEGAKKADAATPIDAEMVKNTVMFAEDGAGYVSFANGDLTGTVKVEKDEKAQVYFDTLTADETDAIADYLGEDYEAIVEEFKFSGTGFKNDVDFQYDAWEEDPHFFYAWDGEKFVAIDAKYDADEDVDNYVFTAAAEGIIIVTDTEIVLAAEETKNPDTGANDVVGVAAALAVVSLIAAGAVSLKK